MNKRNMIGLMIIVLAIGIVGGVERGNLPAFTGFLLALGLLAVSAVIVVGGKSR